MTSFGVCPLSPPWHLFLSGAAQTRTVLNFIRDILRGWHMLPLILKLNFAFMSHFFIFNYLGWQVGGLQPSWRPPSSRRFTTSTLSQSSTTTSNPRSLIYPCSYKSMTWLSMAYAFISHRIRQILQFCRCIL